MLTVLNDTFLKFSSVISDTSSVLQDTKQALSDTKSSDSKVELIKFSGDHKKFWSWYLAIITQLSIAPWIDLFIAATNSVVQSTMNTSLNGTLYAKVISALEGPALQHMIFHSHLQANGVFHWRSGTARGFLPQGCGFVSHPVDRLSTEPVCVAVGCISL
jgi:hypothetical protein